VTPPAAIAGRWSGASLQLVARLFAIAIVAIAAFVHLVHLGHPIDVAGAGRFDSRYTADELDALARARAGMWKPAPPPTRPPRFSQEDQYLTEGLQHVQTRNRAFGAGDPATAWRENLILERYFAPVLDIGHRWPPPQREDAERRARGHTDAPPFVSRAFPYPLYLWSPIALWAVALVGAATAWLVGARAARV
jgi:hypothetical protein